MAEASDLYLTYKFIKKLTLPFAAWPAHQLGIIDQNGNVLKKRATLRTQAERSAWGHFDIIVANLKKLLGKLPGGKSQLASYAAAALLLFKEEFDAENEQLVEEKFNRNLYYLQPNGSWKKGGDGRSKGRETPPKGATIAESLVESYVFHGTSKKHVDSIKKHGLKPNEHGNPLNFHHIEDSSRYYAGKDGIMLRVKKNHLPSDTRHDSLTQRSWTQGHVNPKHIEIEHEGKWKKLTENVATNAVGQGAVSGLGQSPEPALFSTFKKYRKKDRSDILRRWTQGR